jgi:hypothetical protein
MASNFDTDFIVVVFRANSVGFTELKPLKSFNIFSLSRLWVAATPEYCITYIPGEEKNMNKINTKYKKDNFLNEKFFAFDMVIVEPI